MQASQLRLLYKQSYGNVAVLSLMSFRKLYNTDQFVAGFFPDPVHLQNKEIAQFSSSVTWKRFLCSPVKPSLSTAWA